MLAKSLFCLHRRDLKKKIRTARCSLIHFIYIVYKIHVVLFFFFFCFFINEANVNYIYGKRMLGEWHMRRHCSMAMSSQYIEIDWSVTSRWIQIFDLILIFIIFHYPQLYYIIHDYYKMDDKTASERLFTILFLFLLSNMDSAFWSETDDDNSHK